MVREYPNLGERSYQTTLSNGLRVQVVPKPGFSRKVAFLATNYGSIDMNFLQNGKHMETPAGVAHYLEHKMFDLPNRNVMEEFSLLGASSNAFTSYGITAYYFECTDHFEQSLRLLLEMVYTPYFTDDSVEKERGIIEQELRMYDDSADSQVSEMLYAALFENHPMRIPIGGTVQSIAKITPKILYDCYHTFYDPSNMVLCVVGDVEPSEVAELAERHSPKSSGVRLQRDYGSPEPLERSMAKLTRKMDIAMPTFQIAFRAKPLGEESLMTRELLGNMAAELLMDEGSALYQRLYSANLIDSGFGAGYESIRGMGMMSAGGDTPEPERVVEGIMKEAEHISRVGFDRTDFERLRRASLGRKIRALDSPEGLCYRICESCFDGIDPFTFPQVFAQLTPENALALMQDTIRPERMALSIIYPTEE